MEKIIVHQAEDNPLMKLSETYWRDYLEQKNYNKDVSKMCELCIEEQVSKYGSQVIPCKGLNTARDQAPSTEIFDDFASNLLPDDIEALDAFYNPFTYMKLNLDIDNPQRNFQERFYQKLILSCSAKEKVVRMGRRTGKSQSIAMLAVHKAIMNENYRILLVSPYAVQTEEVINTIKTICQQLPENPLAASKQTPAWKLTFTNGTILMGFTASTNGDQIRGQPADLIILDETDDIPEKAINSIMGIKMQNIDVEVWRSGTPKGEKNLHKSEQSRLSKSFHYPSYVIPQYSDLMDQSLRDEMGEGLGYVEEVLAEISSGSNQVFQSIFLSRALNKSVVYSATDVLADRQRFIVTIGVDWNHDQVGSRLIVIAYDKINPQFYIIDKERIAIEGFTQHAAVERIIALNRKYNCDHVFVDQGFGASQVASLKQFAMAQAGVVPKGHPDLKLLDVTPIDYGSSTEILDPVTGDSYKTPTKQLAVLSSVEVFEKDLITLQAKEDHDIILQLKNYVEKSRNKGRVVYGYLSKKIGDHDLDALMIAVFGMKKTYSTLFVGESTQALLRIVESSDSNKSNIDVDEVDLEVARNLFGLSFGKSSRKHNDRNTKNKSSSDRLSGFNRKRSRV